MISNEQKFNLMLEAEYHIQLVGDLEYDIEQMEIDIDHQEFSEEIEQHILKVAGTTDRKKAYQIVHEWHKNKANALSKKFEEMFHENVTDFYFKNESQAFQMILEKNALPMEDVSFFK